MLPRTKSWEQIGRALGVDFVDFSGIPDTNPEIELGVTRFERLTAEEQIRVLGPAKYAAYRDGEIALSDLVGQKYSREWGYTRYEKSLRELGFNWRQFSGVAQSSSGLTVDELQQIGTKLENEIGPIVSTTQRWSGIIKLVTPKEAPGYLGAKDWSCDIILRTDARLSTLVHELLHGHSEGLTVDTYVLHRGWEEGVIEKLQRLLGPGALSAIGETPIQGTHAYNGYISALEKLRKWSAKDESEFYLGLIRTDLEKRSTTVFRWLQEAGKSERAAKGLLTKVSKYLN